MQLMKGRRIPWPNGRLFMPGEYAQSPQGVWYGKTPNGHLGSFELHEVVEHEDETITVSPSILIKIGEQEVWHGYLERGTWKQL